MNGTGTGRPGFARTWWVAARPFALPASTMPVVFGTVLAATLGGAGLHWGRFAVALLGMALLHTGANLLNDAVDFSSGIDRRVNPVSGAVVRGWITARQALLGAAALFGLGGLLGLWLLVEVGLPILWLGLVGVALGVLYTAPPVALKYRALGDLAVFLDFGVLGALGAWTVQTGSPSWVPAVWAVPMSLLVVGILHANNWRDLESDRAAGIRTVATALGDRRSAVYYAALVLGPYAVILGLIAASRGLDLGPHMPLTFAITLGALPLSIRLIKRGSRRRDPAAIGRFLSLDGATAQLNLLFGLLCTVALGLGAR